MILQEAFYPTGTSRKLSDLSGAEVVILDGGNPVQEGRLEQQMTFEFYTVALSEDKDRSLFSSSGSWRRSKRKNGVQGKPLP